MYYRMNMIISLICLQKLLGFVPHQFLRTNWPNGDTLHLGLDSSRVERCSRIFLRSMACNKTIIHLGFIPFLSANKLNIFNFYGHFSTLR